MWHGLIYVPTIIMCCQLCAGVPVLCHAREVSKGWEFLFGSRRGAQQGARALNVAKMYVVWAFSVLSGERMLAVISLQCSHSCLSCFQKLASELLRTLWISFCFRRIFCWNTGNKENLISMYKHIYYNLFCGALTIYGVLQVKQDASIKHNKHERVTNK